VKAQQETPQVSFPENFNSRFFKCMRMHTKSHNTYKKMRRPDFYFNPGMSTGHLLTIINKVCTSAKRDIDHLKTMGITPELVEELEAKAQALNANDVHTIVVGKKKITTNARNLKLEEVKTLIEKLRKQLRLVFSSRTGEFDAIFTKALTRISVEQFIEIAKATFVVLNTTTQNIAIYGVTPEVVANFETKINELVSSHYEQTNKTNVLGSITYERSELKKDAYLLLEHVSAIGKEYWRKTNPAVSKEYDIRKIKASVATAPETNYEI